MRNRRLDLPLLEAFALLLVTGYVTAMAWAMRNFDYDVWGAFVIGPALVLVNIPLLRAAMRHERERRMRHLLAWAFALKLVCAVPRYLMAFVLYGGSADAAAYHSIGSNLASRFRSGDFHLEFQGRIGTEFVRILTGVVYTVTGPSIVGGFLVFSVFGFWGLYLCYRAFVVSIPDGLHWRYACLVFLLPSMLFWSSSIGKEAWMMLSIGVAAYGAARLYTRARLGFGVLVAGLAGAAAVRPHVAAIMLVAVFAGYLLRPGGARSTALTPLAKVAGVSVLVGIGLYVVHLTAGFLGVDTVNGRTVEGVLATAQVRTDEGGSSFVAERVSSPLDIPSAAVQVLLRPFPWEANNLQAMVTALEGVVLVAIALAAWPSLRSLPRRLSRSYALFSTVYVCLFVVAFSSFGNFGIIARERVQVLPFVLVFLCLPPRRRSLAGRPDARADTTTALVHT